LLNGNLDGVRFYDRVLSAEEPTALPNFTEPHGWTATALVAQERTRAAAGIAPVLQISFAKVLELLRPLWLVLAIGGDLLSECQKHALIERFY
jgi:hypothetical protein